MDDNLSDIFPENKGENLVELSINLGNGLEVARDKISAVSVSAVAFSAEVAHDADYYPFVMGMPGRQFEGVYM